ncbi:MAG: hypothetical protein CM15mP18_2860 [Methanobacteriota archaeon]|nr:MAG: hypothetical protein CM15mP18_2860 [Euryarchaeota archaeon]
MWPGCCFGGYFYLIEMYGTHRPERDSLWESHLAHRGGAVMAGSRSPVDRAGEVPTYILVGYFSIGLVGYPKPDQRNGVFGRRQEPKLATIWTGLTTSMHFNMMGPVVMMYVILRYGLFDTSEEMKPKAKLMVITLIVIATSALLSWCKPWCR